MAYPDDNEIGEIPAIDFTEVDGVTYLEPSTPASGQLKLFPKDDHLLYIKDSTGAVTVLDTGTSGAPSGATYITQTPNGTLTNEQALSALATGILKSTTTTGVLSIAVAGTDYLTPAPASSAIDVISAATATIRALALKTTDNNVTNNLLEFLSSTNTVLAHVGATGLAAFAGLDSTIIGGTTPAAATVTTITASSTSGLLMSQSAETTLQTMLDMTPKTAGQPHLKLQYNSFANAGGGAGTYNHGTFIGYNTDFSSGGTPVSSKPVWLWGMEDNYFDNLGDGLYGTEAYLRYVSPDQTTINLRPFYIRIPASDTNAAKNAIIKFDIGSGGTGQFSVWQDATHLIDIQPAGTSLRTVLTMFNNFAFTPTSDSVVLMAVKNSSASSNVLVVDSSSQRVGINANVALGDTPQNKLHIYYGDVRIEQIAAPGAATGALAGAGAGNVNNGAHIYKVTYVNVAGETTLGTSSNTVTVTDLTTNGQVSLTAIPTATAGLQVTSRNIYRTKAGGSTYFLLTTLADNTTTTYTDNTADASLAATDMTSRNNTTAGTIRLGTSLALRLFTNDTSVGVSAMANITSAINTTAVGTQALQNLTTGNANNAFGASAGATMTTGAQNNLFGVSAGTAITSATHNVIVGHSAGNNSGSTASTANAVTTGADNTFIGYQTGLESSTQRTFAIAIGSGASVNASNTAAIGGTTTTNAVDITAGRVTASAKLDLLKPTATTNATIDILWLGAHSTGTPAANFGVGLMMVADSATVVDRNLAYIQAIWNTATDASRKADLVFSVYDTAAREFMRARGSGSAAAIGMFGAGPVVQQTDGAGLTNNVTAGGTTNQIDDFTSLTIYATDAAAIRNDIYQLARKQKIVDDALRLYGWLT